MFLIEIKNITKISSRYTNKAWVSHYANITKASSLKITDRLAKQFIRNMKNKIHQSPK